MFTVGKIARMQNRLEFIIGYRNLVNLAVIFVGAVVAIFASSTSEGIVIGTILMVLGAKYFHDQVLHNIDDLEIQDITEKKDA